MIELTDMTTGNRGHILYYDIFSNRGGPRNSDSMISGSLASPMPPRGGEPKERGDETHETESWGHL